MFHFTISALALLVAASPLSNQANPSPSPTPTPTPTPPPVSNDKPAIRNRIYSSDVSSYDVTRAIGRFAIFDRQTNTVTEFIEKGRSACDPTQAKASLVLNNMPSTTVYSDTFDNKYNGSLSLFTASAELSNEQRQSIRLADLATADLAGQCELSNEKVYEIARTLHGAAGKTVFWVSGATMSLFTKETFNSDGADGKLSAGSWLSLGGGYYKGSNKIDAIPVTSFRGIAVDIPKSSPVRIMSLNARRVSTLSELGMDEKNVKHATATY